ncbi:MAG: hypothetical protein ACK47C_15215 [Paracoccaceae bacterium]
MTGSGHKFPLAATLIFVDLGAAVWWRLQIDLTAVHARVPQGRTVIDTPSSLIEYQEAGVGPVLWAMHGGGGFDQGMAFAAPLLDQGIRVVAMSRLG